MEKLKAELRLLGQHDTGTAENKSAITEAFFEVMLVFLTPAAIETFSGPELRALMVRMLKDAEEDGYQAAVGNFMSHLGVLPYRRPLPPAIHVSDNVVSIFKKG